MSFFSSAIKGATDVGGGGGGGASVGGATSGLSSMGSSFQGILPGGVTGEENDSLFPAMSYQNRLYGFAGCFIFGWILSICSTFSLWTGNLTGFVTLYTLGSIIALFGSGFLVGPWRQCQLMWKPVRAVATAVYLGTLIATICVAVLTGNAIATLICVIIQLLSAIWYSASYIPFARQAIRLDSPSSIIKSAINIQQQPNHFFLSSFPFKFPTPNPFLPSTIQPTYQATKQPSTPPLSPSKRKEKVEAPPPTQAGAAAPASLRVHLSRALEVAQRECDAALEVAPLSHAAQEENARAARVVVRHALAACATKALRDFDAEFGEGTGIIEIGKEVDRAVGGGGGAGKEKVEIRGREREMAREAVEECEARLPLSRQWVAEIRGAQVSRVHPRVSYEIYVRLTVFSDSVGEAPITGSCVVRRRYRDFSRLYNELSSYFHNQAHLFVVIPNIPPKDFLFHNRTDLNLVYHRRCALQHWLDYVCSHHLLRNSTALRQFLWQASTSAVTERASLDSATISATARLQSQMNIRKEAVLAFHAEEAQIVALRKAFRSSAVAHLQMNALVRGLEQTYRSSAQASRHCRHADASLLQGRRKVSEALRQLCEFENVTAKEASRDNDFVFLGRFAVGLGQAFEFSSSSTTLLAVSNTPIAGAAVQNNNIKRHHNRGKSGNNGTRFTGAFLESDHGSDAASFMGGGGDSKRREGSAARVGYSVGTTYEGFLPNPVDNRWREESSFNTSGTVTSHATNANDDDNRSITSRISTALKTTFLGSQEQSSSMISSTTSFFPTIVEAGEIHLPKTPCIHFDCLSLKRFEYLLILWGAELFPEVKKGFVHPSTAASHRKVTVRYTDDLIENVPPPRTITERCAAEWVELGIIRPTMIRDAAIKMVKNQIAHARRERRRWEAIKAEIQIDTAVQFGSAVQTNERFYSFQDMSTSSSPSTPAPTASVVTPNFESPRDSVSSAPAGSATSERSESVGDGDGSGCDVPFSFRSAPQVKIKKTTERLDGITEELPSPPPLLQIHQNGMLSSSSSHIFSIAEPSQFHTPEQEQQQSHRGGSGYFDLPPTLVNSENLFASDDFFNHSATSNSNDEGESDMI